MSEWLPADQDPRLADPTPPRGEIAVVRAYLRHYRLTLELKLAGLDAEQLARRAVPPSSLSLLGLLRHLAQVEHHWFRLVLQGVDEPQLYSTDESPDAEFDGAVADDAVVAQAWAAWRREVGAAERHLDEGATRPGFLERLVTTGRGEEIEVRDVLVHLVEEYARHLGHVDLLRECIDGRVGQ